MEQRHLDTTKNIEATSDDISLGSFDDLDSISMAAEAAAARRQRYALVFDATSSMSSWWRATQEALQKAVDDIKSRTDVPIQIKVVAYRDHDYDGYLVTEESEWSDDTSYLKTFIQSVQCAGGGDYPESIGHGLQRVLQQSANMVILIGDAPSKQGSWGWDEAKILGQDKCPINALYVTDNDDQLRECFERLAKLSGGKAAYLARVSNLTDVLKTVLISNKTLAIDYQPETEEGKRIKALLG